MEPYPGPPPFYQGRERGREATPQPAEAPRRAGESRATVALVLGIVSMVGFVLVLGGVALGFAAIILGALVRRDARRAGHAPASGATLAIVTGAFGIVLNLAFAVGYVAGLMDHVEPPPIARVLARARAPEASPHAAGIGRMTPTAEAGPVHLEDLDASDGSLRAQLAAKTRDAKHAGAKVLVMTAANWSKDSREVALTLSDPSMQLALAGVWIVRVDVDTFKAELAAMKLETDEAPLFFLLGGSHEPVDVMGAESWEANDAESLAPVLHAFVHGKLPRRDLAPKAGGSGGTSL